MAENIRLKVKGSSGFDTYHPETNFGQVIKSDGVKLSDVLVDSTTTKKGLVQLTDSTTSTSVTTAATPKSVKDALDAAKSHTSTSIASLVNSAPETLDTLKEIADAIQLTDGVVNGLLSSIASKASTADLTAHTGKKASLTEVGHIQLSNKYNGESQILAVTEKAVNDLRIDMDNKLFHHGLIGQAEDISGQNPDNITSNGLYMGSNLIGAPTNDWFFIEHMRHNEKYAKQIIHRFTVIGAMTTFSRVQVSGIWGPWVKSIDEYMRNAPNGFLGLDGSGNLPAGVGSKLVKLGQFDLTSPAAEIAFTSLSKYSRLQLRFIRVRHNNSNVSQTLLILNDNTVASDFAGLQPNSGTSYNTYLALYDSNSAGVLNGTVDLDSGAFGTCGYSSFMYATSGYNTSLQVRHFQFLQTLNKIVIRNSNASMKFDSGIIELWGEI